MATGPARFRAGGRAAGNIRKLAPLAFLEQRTHAARQKGLHRAAAEDFNKVTDVFTQAITNVAIRRDGRDDHQHAVTHQQLALIPKPEQIGGHLFSRKTQVAIELLADAPGIEHLHLISARSKQIAQALPDRRLTRAGKTRKPDGETFVQYPTNY